MLNKQDLQNSFQNIGLRSGDTVLVHSSLRTLGPVDGGADTVIDALLETVGPDGILAMPTHTFKVVNAQQPIFHQALTPSCVGALTEVFRKRSGTVRGLHPTHSIAAVGPRADEFIAIREQDSTPCPPESPYGRLRTWNGKVLIIGVGLECCTFFHGCEEWAEMPWATAPEERQLYSITTDGRLIPIRMRGHRIRTWLQYPRLEPGLNNINALITHAIHNCPLRLLDAAPAADWLIRQLRRDADIILPDDTKETP